MKSRKLLIALATAGIATAGFGAAVFPASAEPRTFQIKLTTGQTVTVTVDVPPGTPVDQIEFPGVSAGIVSVTEVTPPPSAQPGVEIQTGEQPPPPPAQTAPAPAPEQPKGDDSREPESSEPKASKGGGKQKTTGRKQRKENGDIIPDDLAEDLLDEDEADKDDRDRRGTAAGSTPVCGCGLEPTTVGGGSVTLEDPPAPDRW